MTVLRRALPVALAALVAGGCGGEKKIPNTLPPTSTDSDGCLALAKTPDPETRRAPRPTKPLDSSKTYDVTFRTNCGSFTIRLDPRTSPETAASFASLVRRRYFDGTVFHRIVPGFVLQGGDPTGTGAGGPGYSTRDRVPAGTTYTLGVAAMAKTAAEPPGTAGSQFFVVTTKDARLPPEYAVLGKVVDGLDAAVRMGQLGDPQTGAPSRLVEIRKATLDVH